jgi:hypothetical protein
VRRIVLACLLVAGVMAMRTGGAEAAPPFGTNLIVNGNAEAGSAAPNPACGQVAIPGWTVASGQVTVVAYGPLATNCPDILAANSAPDAANQLFSGGQNSTSGTLTQTINVSAAAGIIDSGNAIYTLSGWLGGWSTQGDNATVTATFRNASNASVGTVTIGPVSAADRGNANKLLFRQSSSSVPATTRTIEVAITVTRTEGTYDDGSADSLSLVLSLPDPCTTTPVTSNASRVTVNSGELACVYGGSITGQVVVNPGGAVALRGATVGGAIQTNGASSVTICSSNVKTVNVGNSTGQVRIGGGLAPGCTGNAIGGSTVLTNNHGGVVVGANQITGPLSCSGNVPAPTNNGLPNSAASKSGDCALL